MPRSRARDALVAALERWLESGVPDNLGAWLMATAKHRAIDRLRRSERPEREPEELGGALGPYALQAAIAACHARARTPAETDWEDVRSLLEEA